MNKHAIRIVRALFVTVCCYTGSAIAASVNPGFTYIGALGGIAFALVGIFIERLTNKLTFRSFSAGVIGLMVGILCSWLVLRLDIFEEMPIFKKNQIVETVFKFATYYFFSFVGVVLALRSRHEEFSLLIPYVRFKQADKASNEIILDQGVVGDSRTLSLLETGFLQGQFIIPRFVVDDIQKLMRSDSEAGKVLGKRAMTNLEKLMESENLDCEILDDYEAARKSSEQKLIELAILKDARLFSSNGQTIRDAKLRKVKTLSFEDLSDVLRPVLNTGDEMEIRLVKKGKEDHQAIGFLQDGGMVVVNNASNLLGNKEVIVVTGEVQTSAGRLIFGELKENYIGQVT